jgi:hypothetical protein
MNIEKYKGRIINLFHGLQGQTCSMSSAIHDLEAIFDNMEMEFVYASENNAHQPIEFTESDGTIRSIKWVQGDSSVGISDVTVGSQKMTNGIKKEWFKWINGKI